MVVRLTAFRCTLVLVIAPARARPAALAGSPPEQPPRWDARPALRQMLMPWAEDYIP